MSGPNPFDAIAHLASLTQAYADLPRLDPQTISAWPITDKATVKSQPEHYLSSAAGPAARCYTTSGSTGTPLKVLRTAGEHARNIASVAEAMKPILPLVPWAVGTLSSDGPAAVDLYEGIVVRHGGLMLRRFPYNPNVGMAGVVADLKDPRTNTLITTPGVASDMRAVLGDAELGHAGIEVVLCVGEPLTPARAHVLQWVFGCPVYSSSFGSTETATVAVACRDGRLHLLDHVVAEVLEPGSEVPVSATAGRAGEFVVTNLLAEAMPLVRLATGDRVQVAACNCGDPTLTVTVAGREDDFVRAGGEPIGPIEVEENLFWTEAVIDYRLFAATELEVTRIDLQVVPGTPPVTGQQAADRWLERFGAPITVALTEDLPAATKAGAATKSWRRSHVRVQRGRAA